VKTIGDGEKTLQTGIFCSPRTLPLVRDVFRVMELQPMEHVMKLTVVRYRTKPETADENARLIQAVFQELRAKSPDDVRYLALRLSDGTFIHVSIAETKE